MASLSNSSARFQYPSASDRTPIPASRFAAAFRGLPSGVALITADAGNGPVAMTATSVSSVSADPPILMFSVSDASSSAPTICSAETVVVHLLGPDQLHLARLGATSGIDRFADASNWERLPTGETHAPAADVWVRGRTRDRIRAGNAHIVVVDALEIGGAAPTDPPSPGLVYHNRRWHGLGPHSALPA